MNSADGKSKAFGSLLKLRAIPCYCFSGITEE